MNRKIEIRDKNGNRTIIINGSIGTVIDNVGTDQTINLDGETINVGGFASVSVVVHGNAGSIRTMSGDVQVDGDVNGSVSTMSGEVRCNHLRGNASTMSGDIRIKNKYNMNFE